MFNEACTTFAFHHGEQMVTKKLQSVILEDFLDHHTILAKLRDISINFAFKLV